MNGDATGELFAVALGVALVGVWRAGTMRNGNIIPDTKDVRAYVRKARLPILVPFSKTISISTPVMLGCLAKIGFAYSWLTHAVR